MNKPATLISSPDPDVVEAVFAARVTALLAQQAEALPPDVLERLRFAREQALARAQAARRPDPRRAFTWRPARQRAGVRWWMRLTAVLPLVALLAGLVLIQDRYIDAQVVAAAEIDTALLADSLPPAAYQDSGFVEFLKVSSRE